MSLPTCQDERRFWIKAPNPSTLYTLIESQKARQQSTPASLPSTKTSRLRLTSSPFRRQRDLWRSNQGRRGLEGDIQCSTPDTLSTAS